MDAKARCSGACPKSPIPPSSDPAQVIADQYELGGVSLHLYKGSIPLDRATERVSDTPDNGVYAIAIPSIELQAGAYYLSIKCGPNAQRFRAVAFEVLYTY